MHLAMRLVIYLFAALIYLMGQRISKSILHPIRIFIIFWLALIVIAISCWDIGYPWNGSGLLWIEASLFFTETGALVVTNGQRQICTRNKSENGNYDYGVYNWIIYYMILSLSFLSVALTLSVNGFHLFDIRSFDSLLSVSSEMTHRRYFTGVQTTVIQQIVSIFCSMGVICAGYAFGYAKEKYHKALCLASFVPVILSVLLTTAKSGLIASVILFLGGWSISSLRIKGDFITVGSKLLLKLAGILFGILLFLYFAMLLRVGEFSEETRKIIYDKFFVYAFGEMVEFDGWFAGGRDFHLYQMGSNTYMVLPRMLGLVERVSGVYPTYVKDYGNVFTAFRGIIADFGLFGGLIYSFFRGFITQNCCNAIGRRPAMCYFAMTLVACQYFFGLYGFIISPWIYTTYVLGMLGFLLFMPLFDRGVRFGRTRCG